jgi:hypothetical protein
MLWNQVQKINRNNYKCMKLFINKSKEWNKKVELGNQLHEINFISLIFDTCICSYLEKKVKKKWETN